MDKKDITRLIAYWRTQGVRPNHHLATHNEIDTWEATHRVLLPTDLKQYFLQVNGTHGGDQLEFGDDFYSFLSLSALRPESEWFPSGRAEKFVFVDFLIKSSWFCVDLDDQLRDETLVFWGGTIDPRDRPVATSLREFLSLYCENSPKLQL